MKSPLFQGCVSHPAAPLPPKTSWTPTAAPRARSPPAPSPTTPRPATAPARHPRPAAEGATATARRARTIGARRRPAPSSPGARSSSWSPPSTWSGTCPHRRGPVWPRPCTSPRRRWRYGSRTGATSGRDSWPRSWRRPIWPTPRGWFECPSCTMILVPRQWQPRRTRLWAWRRTRRCTTITRPLPTARAGQEHPCRVWCEAHDLDFLNNMCPVILEER